MTTAPAPHITVAESAEDPEADIWFAEPTGFTAVPLEALLPSAESPSGGDLNSVLEPLLLAAPDELARQQFIARLAQGRQLLGALGEAGVVHCSIGLHRDDVEGAGAGGGGLLLSFLTLSWSTTAASPRAVTAARAVSDLDSQTGVEYAELPCGPATFSETLRTPRAGYGLPELPLLQFYAHLPHPDCRRLAVFTLSTTAVARQREYRVLLRQIAGSACFVSPLE
ncbi:hypothetical protein AB0912_02350 [Streptomyces sp. NPDC007084]|uniref:hypothetical protein n=1 Tax=Streptomyces sp. NPDC007084 TaxID=3154313 RepID=UPI0034569979